MSNNIGENLPRPPPPTDWATLPSNNPDMEGIKRRINTGEDDINDVFHSHGDTWVTRLDLILDGFYKQHFIHIFRRNMNSDNDFAHLKRYLYPFLDLLEEHNFKILQGSSFVWNGTITDAKDAGLHILDTLPFRILEKYDMSRLIQFMERLYFSHGYAVDNRYVNTLIDDFMYTIDKRRPAVIWYLIMKGAQIDKEHMKEFARRMTPDDAVATITKLQNILGINYVIGPEGRKLRESLTHLYGAGFTVLILKNVTNNAGFGRRLPILDAAFGNQVGGKRVGKKSRRRMSKHRKTLKKKN